MDDEFTLLEDNAAEAGLAWHGRPAVERRFADVGGGRRVSALAWGSSPPELVLLHGGAQNAHTWDTVALALGRPLVAVDLPGHGHSDWRADGDYTIENMATDVTVVMRSLAPGARFLVGMGLGSPVAVLVTARHPELVDRLALIDSGGGPSPAGAAPRQSKAGATVTEFVTGQQTFPTFDEMLARTVRYNVNRSERSLRRGVTHNAKQLEDGTWTWRWDPAHTRSTRDFSVLTEAYAALQVPVTLIRGELSDIVTDEGAAAFIEAHPGSRLVTIAGAGHGVQGDRPLELASALSEILGGL
jgi:pimeloyl-ACP methyl ester carboxylesterase